MVEKMIHFVCENNTNKIIKIFKQYKRACNMLNHNNLHVLSYNPAIYPSVENFNIGDCINEYKLEMCKRY